MILIDVDAGLKIFGARLGMELCGIDILPVSDHLHGASRRFNQYGTAFGQGLHRFLMTNEGIKFGLQELG